MLGWRNRMHRNASQLFQQEFRRQIFMRFNKTKLATSVTAAIAMGVASQASAISFSAGDVDASLYGYARLNMTYDLDESIGGSAQDGLFSKIEGTGVDGHFDAGAYQSRVGIRLN